MTDLIISDDFVDLGTITSRTEDASFPDDNVGALWNLKRRFRAGDLNTNDWLLKFNFGAAKSLVAVVLNDVNFDRVVVQTAAGDAWGAPDTSGTVMATVDEQVNRYKIYVPHVYTRQWMRIFIPAGALAVGNYTTKWEVGTVVPLDSINTFSKYSFTRSSEDFFAEIELRSGGLERIAVGDDLRWSGDVTLASKTEGDESPWWVLNALPRKNPLILYENRGVTHKVYLCLRDDAYEGNLVHYGLVKGNVIHFKEII